MVECDLAKVEVAGSTPVSRSRDLTSPALAGLFVLSMRTEPVDFLGRGS